MRWQYKDKGAAVYNCFLRRNIYSANFDCPFLLYVEFQMTCYMKLSVLVYLIAVVLAANWESNEAVEIVLHDTGRTLTIEELENEIHTLDFGE